MQINLSSGNLEARDLAVIQPDAFTQLFDTATDATSIEGVVTPTREVADVLGIPLLLVKAWLSPETQYGEMLIMLCATREREVFQISTSAPMVQEAVKNIPANRYPVKIKFGAGSGRQGQYYYLA